MVASPTMQGGAPAKKPRPLAWRVARAGALSLAVGSMAAIYLPELPWVGRWAYPYPHRATIEREAKKRGLDPLWIAAIIRQESGFHPEARSNVGAMGLMQLMPNTARWAAQHVGLKDFQVAQLADPETNIVLGTWYVAYLLKQFKSMDKVLAAYNGGEGNVSYWGTLRGEQLAYAHPETQSYVASCERSHRRYQSLYGGPLPLASAWPASPSPSEVASPLPAASGPVPPSPAPATAVPRPAGSTSSPDRVPPSPPPSLRPLPSPSARPTHVPPSPTARPVHLPRRVIRIPSSPSPKAED